MINFPNAPVFGEIYTPLGGPTWQWNGYGWRQIVEATTGIEEAPVDGIEYVRKNAAWNVLPVDIASWASITGKPSTFPPNAHTHLWAEITDKPATFPPTLPIAQADVTNLVTDLAAKAPLASPTFTGNPTAPTPATGDEDTSIATTAFVQTAVDSATGAGLFGYFDYTFNPSAYTPPPIAGNFRMNNATQSAATHIYVHEQTATSNDASLMLAQIAVGDKLLIQRKAAATQWQRYSVTAVSDAGTYWDFTVTWVDGGSALTNARTGIVVQKPALVSAEPPITVGTTAQYWRGDKSWQTLDKAAVGLGSVDNTADTAKPVSTAQQTAIAGRVADTGDTMTGPLVLSSSTTGSAGLNFGVLGVAPTTPAEGDFWISAAGTAQYRMSGTSYGLATTNGSQTFSGAKNFTVATKFMNTLATPAGGTTGSGITFGTTTNLGIFFGSGAPTLTAAQGSIYLRSDGSSTSTRLYINTTGSTVWTGVNTVA